MKVQVLKKCLVFLSVRFCGDDDDDDKGRNKSLLNHLCKSSTYVKYLIVVSHIVLVFTICGV